MNYYEVMGITEQEADPKFLDKPACILNHPKAGKFVWTNDELLKMSALPIVNARGSLMLVVIQNMADRMVAMMVKQNPEYFDRVNLDEYLFIQTHVMLHVADFMSRPEIIAEFGRFSDESLKMTESEFESFVTEVKGKMYAAVQE